MPLPFSIGWGFCVTFYPFYGEGDLYVYDGDFEGKNGPNPAKIWVKNSRHHLLKKQRNRPIGDAFLISCVSPLILRLKRYFLNYIILHRETLSSFHLITSEGFSALILRFPIGVHLWFLWTQTPLTRRFSFFPVWVQISAFAPFDFPLSSWRFSTSSPHSSPRCFFTSRVPNYATNTNYARFFCPSILPRICIEDGQYLSSSREKKRRHDFWWNHWKF